VDTVVKGVEAPLRGLLGRSPQPPLKSSHVHRVRPHRTGSRRRHETRYGRRAPAGGTGPGRPGHALALTLIRGTIKVRALPCQRVIMHAGHRYYDPPGLPLPSRRLHHRLIHLVFARRRPGRRASPVPAQTVRACHPPYPGRTRQADPGTGPDGHGLRRDMSGSAPPLFLCRGCQVRLMLRPARLLPPKRLLTPRSARRLSAANRGLLPGAPVPTRTGLSPVSLDQLSGRNMGTA